MTLKELCSEYGDPVSEYKEPDMDFYSKMGSGVGQLISDSLAKGELEIRPENPLLDFVVAKLSKGSDSLSSGIANKMNSPLATMISAALFNSELTPKVLALLGVDK